MKDSIESEELRLIELSKRRREAVTEILRNEDQKENGLDCWIYAMCFAHAVCIVAHGMSGGAMEGPTRSSVCFCVQCFKA